jgi:hypothetical protein
MESACSAEIFPNTPRLPPSIPRRCPSGPPCIGLGGDDGTWSSGCGDCARPRGAETAINVEAATKLNNKNCAFIIVTITNWILYLIDKTARDNPELPERRYLSGWLFPR